MENDPRIPTVWSAIVLALLLMLTTVGCGGGLNQNSVSKSQNQDPGGLALDRSSLDFGSVNVGNSKNLSVTLTNTSSSGSSSVTVTQIVASGTGFSVTTPPLPLTLAPAQSAKVTVTFAPRNGGVVNGTLSVSVQGSDSPTTIPTSGDGISSGSLNANPSALSFGKVQVGNSSSKFETVTNAGSSAVKISGATTNNAAYSYSGISLPITLSSNQSVTFTVTFAPTGVGAINGTLTLNSDADNSPTVISLSGTGTAQGQLTVSPASLNFGSVVVGASAVLNANLTASGQTVTVSSVSSTNPEFVVSGINFPAAIAAGQSLQFAVTFTPQNTGTTSGTLSFVSDASNSPTQQSVNGNGTAPPQHSVDLSWNASGSQDVVGYNVYRGQKSGGPYSMINGSLDPSLNYTDNTVNAGQTYYYVVTSVDTNGLESGYSNQSKAVVPTP